MDDHNSYGRQVHQALASIGPALQAITDQADRHAQDAVANSSPPGLANPPAGAGQVPGPQPPNSDNAGLSPKP